MATIPTRGISQFKSKLVGGGARANLFEVQVNFPDGISQGIQGDGGGVFDADNFRFLCKSAALPASNVAPIDVPFRGRILKVAGDRTFDSWTITVMNDTDFSIRSAFENWMNTINRVSDNTGLTNTAEYQADAFVYQLDRDGSTLRAYQFYDVFPTQVSAIELSYDSGGDIENFTVELQVLWWEAFRGNSPQAGGQDIT